LQSFFFVLTAMHSPKIGFRKFTYKTNLIFDQEKATQNHLIFLLPYYEQVVCGGNTSTYGRLRDFSRFNVPNNVLLFWHFIMVGGAVVEMFKNKPF